MRFYCTSTGPIGGLDCEVLLYFNWSHMYVGGLNCEVLLQTLYKYIHISAPHKDTHGGCLILTVQLIPPRCWRRWSFLPRDKQGLEELEITSWTERVRKICMYVHVF